MEDRIKQALGKVKDPDLGKDLVSLNMFTGMEEQEGTTLINIRLTTPACPMKVQIETDCLEALAEEFGPEHKFKVVFDASVTTARTRTEVLPDVKNIIVVASGKGGVGKSTLSVNLALSLAKTGARVGLIDADIYGPSIPTMLGLRGAKPAAGKMGEKTVMLPVEAHGIQVLSIGFLVSPSQAVVWRGPMVSSALRQFVTDCHWGELDYLVVDLPPGTGDIHLTLVQTMPVTGAVVVTTPQEVALADARKAVGMFRMPKINVPILGIVENMSWFTPPELPDKKYYLFGKDGGARLADEYELPLLAQIPLEQGIQEGGDFGHPVALHGTPERQEIFTHFAQSVARQVAIRNEELAPTEVVKITR